MASEILVRGESEVRTLPDRAVLRVAVEAEGESQSQAFGLASELANQVDAVLDRYAEAIDRRMTAGVVVHPRTRWRKGQSVRTGWVAGRTTVVELKDFANIGPLVYELSSAGASDIQGPSWQVDDSNPAHDQARRAAAMDARRRASAYAEALGLRLGAMKWLSEPGLRLGGATPVSMRTTARMAFASAAASEEEPMNVEPDEITIAASVEASFEVGEGD